MTPYLLERETVFNGNSFVRLPYANLRFSRNHRSISGNQDWDMCEITIPPEGRSALCVHVDYTTQNVNDMEKHRVMEFLFMLKRVFELGQADKASQIRHVLGAARA